MDEQDSKLRPSPNWVILAIHRGITRMGEAFPASELLFATIRSRQLFFTLDQAFIFFNLIYRFIMITIHGSKIRNLTDKIVKVTSHPSGSSWVAQRGDFISIPLQDIPQADQNESVATYRIDFTVQDEPQYGVFSTYSNWNQLYYSTDPGHYFADTDHRVLGANGGYTTALVPDSTLRMNNAEVTFQVTILDKRQIMVQANVEAAQVGHP